MLILLKAELGGFNTDTSYTEIIVEYIILMKICLMDILTTELN